MRSIQVVLYTGLTEVILALPALRALRDHHPAARLSVVTGRSGQELLSIVPWIDEAIAIARWRNGELLRPDSSFRTFRALWRMRRLATQGLEPDLTLNLSGGLGSRLLREVIGGRGTESSRRSERNGVALQNIHRSHLYLRQLETLGVRPSIAHPELRTNPEADRRIDNLLEKIDRKLRRKKGRSSSTDASHLLIGIHPGRGTGTSETGWPIDRFATLGRRLISNFDARIVVVTGPGERDRGAALARELPPEASIGIDPLPLTDYLSLVARMSTLIGNAGAAVHLAATVGTPVASISISRGPTPVDVLSPAAITIRAPDYELPDLRDEEAVFQSVCQLIGLRRTTLFRDRI
ncbi:MAG: lipopolysaccharide heptosyltransferase family protein [Acidobacteria bacterium]|nr:lipopolysaccharide heptosyltransferase family protein [Acidobacteriota bacterium]